MTTVHSRFYYNTSLPSPTNGWHCCLSEPKIILMPAEYNFLSFLIRETPVVFMHAAAGSKTAGLLYSLSLWYALSGQAACLDGSSWAVLQQVFTDRLGRDADVLCCGDLLIVFYKHMPVVQASRRYIPTAALWLAVLLGIQRQTINIVLLVFFFFFLDVTIYCDDWRTGDQIPCRVHQMSTFCWLIASKLWFVQITLEEKKVIATKALFESCLCCVYTRMKRKKKMQSRSVLLFLNIYICMSTHCRHRYHIHKKKFFLVLAKV